MTNSSGSTTQKFAYEGNNIYADLDSSGNVVTLYVTGAGGGTLYGRIQSGTVYWVVQDHEGSVREVISGDGSTVLDAVTYTDTGSISSQTNSAYMGNYGYTGLRFESVTGFSVANDRWYNPSVAQWDEIDPILTEGGLSNFRDYVGNDWSNNSDLTGEAEGGAVISYINPFTNIKTEEMTSAQAAHNPKASFNLYASISNSGNGAAGASFGFFTTIEGSVKAGQGYGGNNTFLDTDSLQVAVRWSNGRNADLGHDTNALNQGKRTQGASWEHGPSELAPGDPKKILRSGVWSIGAPEGATHVEIVLVYTDVLKDTPLEAGTTNGWGGCSLYRRILYWKPKRQRIMECQRKSF